MTPAEKKQVASKIRKKLEPAHIKSNWSGTYFALIQKVSVSHFSGPKMIFFKFLLLRLRKKLFSFRGSKFFTKCKMALMKYITNSSLTKCVMTSPLKSHIPMSNWQRWLTLLRRKHFFGIKYPVSREISKRQVSCRVKLENGFVTRTNVCYYCESVQL